MLLWYSVMFPSGPILAVGTGTLHVLPPNINAITLVNHSSMLHDPVLINSHAQRHQCTTSSKHQINA